MVLKKRHSINVQEDGPKKRRKDVECEEPEDIKKKAKKGKDYPVKVETRLSDDDDDEDDDYDDDVEEVENDEEEVDDKLDADPDREENDEIGWPKADMIELFNKIETNIPSNDTMLHSTRVNRLDWGEIAFNNYSPSECKRVWTEIHKKIRHYRILQDIISDARVWVHQPWTNFYKGSKHDRHPDLPRRPLSKYMCYYMAKKDKVAKQNPHLDMTQISSVVSQMYNALPESKLTKYALQAEELKKEYEEKMRIFHAQNPNYEQDTKMVRLAITKKASRATTPGGLPKPRPAKQMFIEDRLDKLKDEPNFDKTEVRAQAKQQWDSLSDKKRLVWINWAAEAESKYIEKLKLHQAENPDFQIPKMKSVLTKEEVQLRNRAAGKPASPPNSAYSLYSKTMLAKCADLKKLLPKDRMKEISLRWRKLSKQEIDEYQKKVDYERERYKLEYATYLESLPEEERQELLLKSQKITSRTARARKPKAPKESAKKAKSKKSSAEGAASKKVEREYFPGEPHQPPVNAYDLFVASFVSDTKLNAKEAPRFWEMLPTSDKAKFTRKLAELKEKYIKDYKKFLKSLDEEQVAKYNDLQKLNKEREIAAEANKAQSNDADEDSGEGSSSEEEVETVNNKKKHDSDSDENNENENKKSDSSSDSSSSSSESSSDSSSSDDSDSSSDDSDDEDKSTNRVSVKKEESDSDSSD